MSRLPLSQVRVALVLCLLPSGCAHGVREGAVDGVMRRSAPSTKWSLTLDRSDRISTQHVENLLRRAGVEASAGSAGSFTSWSLTFTGDDARRAQEALTADPSWPEVEARLGGRGSFTDRLSKATPVIRDSSVESAIAWLDRNHPPASAVLRDPTISRFGDGPSHNDRYGEDELLIVASMAVLDRRYLDRDGARRVGCEVRVEMRTSDGRWGREWWGQVLAEGDGWELLSAGASGGDRSPRK